MQSEWLMTMYTWTVRLEGAPKRVNHTCVAIGHYVYSFGGYCSDDDYQNKRPIDVHIFNINTYTWRTLPAPPPEEIKNVPFNRYGHTCIAYGKLVYLWGGRYNPAACNTLYCFDTTKLKWSKPEVQGSTPGPRDGHSACVIEHCMYVFGGFEEGPDVLTDDLFFLDLRTLTWQTVFTTGRRPIPRDFHTASSIGHLMLVFGGRGDDPTQMSAHEVYSNKLFILNTKTYTWETILPTTYFPEGRRSHSAFVFEEKLYIFGGFNGNTHFNDLFQFDLAQKIWTPILARMEGPCRRRRQACSVIGSKAYIFGGTSPDRNAIPDSENDADESLIDHSDLYILDFAPTLRTLCLLKVRECETLYNMDTSELPTPTKKELAYMNSNRNQG